MVTFRVLVAALTAALVGALGSAEEAKTGKAIRAGIIGLDTSHAPAFAKTINDPKATGPLADVKVVAAFPGGSPDIPSSADRVKGYTDQFRAMNIEIVDSIDELLKRVDVVLIESVDGRPHLAQARPVIAAGKPLFIDKPMAASLADAVEIFRLANEKKVPCFSASSLRYSSGFQAARQGDPKFGKIRRCVASSPMSLEPHHPDLFWYGIHGVETLFTIMGPGCQTVTRKAPDHVVGVWADGRQGEFLAKKGYGAEIEGDAGKGEAGKFEGYGPLVVEVCKFFKTGVSPVPQEETLEILAFMEAADESKRLGGSPVSLPALLEKAKKK